ncbi:inositol monophosphatase family protein [Georgenia faecalis]|uniref:Inositol-1-monophosphatase n=1 Tax=Georgenia faecalis TaxID=2483799 RepID=A0ABV9DAT3_9MICO|nr:inositol monophosphatase family protein [Georgenia faecalis]
MGTHDRDARGTGDGLPPGVDVAALMELAERLARQAGRVVAEAARTTTVTVARTKSSSVDVVTEVDEAAERLLRAEITAARPDDAILGEEEETRPGTSGLTWVIDPIDGTVNFLYGLPHYSVSVAVVAGPPDPASWTLLAGCVHAPALGRTWTAGRGAGAFADGVRLAPLAGPPPLERALVGTGFSYSAAGRAAQGRVVAELLPQVRDIRRLGSAAVDLCHVAAGSLDAHYEEYLNPWDMAAGALLVSEVGGVVRGLGDDPAGPGMTIAAHPDLAASLAGAIAGARTGVAG